MNAFNTPTFIKWRFYTVLLVIFLAVVGLVWRVCDLAIFNQPFLKQQGDERVLRLVSTPAFRGMIIDRNGFPLAVSTMVYSVWINPQEFHPTHDDLILLSKQLKLPIKEIKQIALAAQKKKREFAYLKRGLPPQVASDIKALAIPNVFLQEAYRRYYPEGETAGHVIGFTNIDDQGQEGLELAYNKWLQGEPGKKWVMKDRLGRIISDVQTVQDQKSGHDLQLSLDRRIQYLAYRELYKGVIENEAVSGSAIVLDVKTGEVLAMVNQPAFNPNNRTNNRDAFRNRAITDTFEPGSAMKAFAIASALASGLYQPDSIINTSPGWLVVDRNMVRDHKNLGEMSLGQIVQHSSNVGITKVVLSLPSDQFTQMLSRFGFGETTGIGFPGEQAGMITRPAKGIVLATLSFGYGLSVTPLQLAAAYAVIANEGKKVPVSLLRVDKVAKQEQVLDKKQSEQMLRLLESVVAKGGTAVAASVPGYQVAGKTGTAWLASNGGYEKNRYNSTFVGVAPANHPRFVVAVMIHDPRGKKYYAGDVSAPVFERIMEGTLRIFDVSPDQVG